MHDCNSGCKFSNTNSLANNAINTNADGEIPMLSEAAAYTGTINIANLGISDLTGIEAFVNLTNLDCSNNLLTNF
ncbi:MAG: hypothetical protein IPO27_05700 [Bacteroidetes bacterium]|nr:hypothetical protein [Bacteroidota bacterium]